ncbi:MAG TPA: SpoIIE family protein phosphatase, partial [Bacillota bacterium]|nr:SpoIIE family protein phosphatase [Bacillota bacterium]
RTNLDWQSRIGDCRQLVADQLSGISRVVTQLAAEIDMEVKFKKNLEESIHLELDRKGIRVREVLVLEKAGASIEVNITKKTCMGKRECSKSVAPIVSRILGKPMSCINRECIQAGRPQCTLRLIESRKFEVTTGIARKAKHGNTVCGDSYSFTPIKDGKYLLALSDGMGSGTRAQEESSAVISLMENFFEAGFDQAITIKTINSVLMLRSRDEMYATADLCVIDLIDASMEFIKIGGVPSFIYNRGRVQIIKNNALPIGILEDVQTDVIGAKLKDEDIIILATDGILDAFSSPGDAEKALASLIADLNTNNPQQIADTIMDRALALSGNKAKDDMTVLAGRVWSKL